jgi:hypothetical protein
MTMDELETISIDSMEMITGGAAQDPCSFPQIWRRCNRIPHPAGKAACVAWELWRCRSSRRGTRTSDAGTGSSGDTGASSGDAGAAAAAAE